MVPSLGRILKVLALIVPLLTALIEQQNCVAQFKRQWSGAATVQVLRIESSLPACAFDGLTTFEGRPGALENILEWADGYKRLLRSAREQAPAPAQGASEQLTILMLDTNGYKATFRVGSLKPPEVHTEYRGLPCAPAAKRTARHTQGLGCDASLGIALRRALTDYEPDVVEYAYVRDFQKETLTVDVTYCGATPEDVWP